MIRVAIESPYKPKHVDKLKDPTTYARIVRENEEFAQAVCREALILGYNPYAMHLFFTRFLDDSIPEQRTLGILCGLDWTDQAQEVWFCLRPGGVLTEGMLKAVMRNQLLLRPVKYKRFTDAGQFLHDITYEEALGHALVH